MIGLESSALLTDPVRDGLEHGFGVVVLADAIRAIEARPGDARRAEREMVRLGAVLARQRLPAS